MNSYTDRYIYAATRTVPENGRPDLRAELEASIRDAVDARVGSGDTLADAERTVLTELGDPDKLAADYSGRPLHLIGRRYFLDWWRLLRLLLWIIVPVAAFGVALGKTLSGAPVGDIIGSAIVVSINVVVHLGFWTTLVFAIVERASAREVPPTSWSLDRLPQPSRRGASLGDMLSSLIFLGIAVGAVLWDRFVGFVPTDPGLMVLDPGLWPWWIAGLFVLIAFEAAVSVVVYAASRWTMALALVNAALNLVIGVAAIWLLVEGRLLNPAFFTAIIPTGDAERVGAILVVILGFVIGGIAIWSAIDSLLKARRP